MKKVIANLKLALTNNVGIKIIALLFAAILWLTVVNINDPDKTIVVYHIPITITDVEVLEEQNMVYDSGIQYYVDVTVHGKRSIVSTLDEGNFRATASLKELSKVNSVPVDVVVKSASKARSITITKQSVQTINLKVEQIQETEFNLEAEFQGNLAKGYSIGEYRLYKDQITVDAPTSVLENIDRVAVVCSVDNVSEDIKGKSCRVVLYDAGNKVISIKKNNITLSSTKVKLDVDILKEVTVPIVPLTVDNIGEPAADCRVREVTLSRDTVTVRGEAEVVNRIKEIDISSLVDISSDNQDVTKEIDLSALLPKSVTLSSGNTMSVEIKIDKYATRSITVAADDIELKNGDNAYDISIVSKSISIQFYGKENELQNLTAEDLKVTVDMSGISAEGTQDVKAEIQGPRDIVVVNDVTVKVKIKSKN